MNKFLFALFFSLFPILVFSDDTITFAPPTTDYSVRYLADIFGIVDGVLHGTGSQILGSIFEVFNAAVMALGGMIITYTMLVSTMNTAHEGEMLGKKWNSIWVPVRATAGFALLIPKASGYCLLQIFVMWVVVQGVGAADKLWNAALGYLNRGGVIIQQQQNPVDALTSTAPATVMMIGAMNILSGQVCMLAVQKTLEQKLDSLKRLDGANGNSVCNAIGVSPSFKAFCNSGSVPNFADTVDAVAAQNLVTPSGGAPSTATSVTVPMPNFKLTDKLYSRFNGICGSIQWNMMTASQSSSLQSSGLTSGEFQTAVKARAIAVQQMYTDLLMVAQVMVGNDPEFAINSTPSLPPPSNGQKPKPPSLMEGQIGAHDKLSKANSFYTSWATVAFGEPLNLSNDVCTDSTSPNCHNWGLPDGGGSALLNGTELQGAVLDYIGVMQPTLTLLAQASAGNSAAQSKAFIETAERQGWIMAGTYFFDLVVLNNQNLNNATGSNGVDSDSGLDGSQFSLTGIQASFPLSSGSTCATSTGNPILCELVQGDSSVLAPIISLFTGQSFPTITTGSASPSANPAIPPIAIFKTPPIASVAGKPSSTVFSYLQNANVIRLPGTPAPQPLMFANMMQVHFNHTSFQMPNVNFSCMGIYIFAEFCIGRWIGEIIYNIVINTVISFFTSMLETLIYGFLMTALTIPLEAFAVIFKVGVQILDVPGINPIVALANMGTYYINFVGKLWFIMLVGQLVNLVLSIVGIVMLPIMAMAMPVVIAWSIIMLGIGMTTAYYVPLIPYMIFTFGAIAWFMAVVEAMVAAPIVALGIIHPEGHDAFGKGEAAIMILMNVFLRPAMMIIGYIAAISLSYVGVWLLNASFDHAVAFMQPSEADGMSAGHAAGDLGKLAGAGAAALAAGPVGIAAAAGIGGIVNAYEANHNTQIPGTGAVSGGYVEWAGVFAYFFSILIYTMMYMTIVEKAFTLISVLPDKVLRWIGGQPESHGQDAAQWMTESKGKVEKAGEKSGDSMAQAGKGVMGGISPPDTGGADASKGASAPPAGGEIPPV